MGVKTFLTGDYSAQSLTEKISKIPHDDSGSGLLAARAFRKREMLWFYYGTLLCTDLTRKRHKTRIYRERVMPMIVGLFGSKRTSYRKSSTRRVGLTAMLGSFLRRSAPCGI